ncbi:Glutamate synthase [NADPH] small chain [uncultured Clostridium sp.]|nr:Glutamate synthase [NADPH] small chain [uncultured Clostridium sp.]
MTPIPFGKLLAWVLDEYKLKGTIFGINKEKFYRNLSNSSINILGENISTCMGPAAGPHSQLTQNIVAAYLAGSRFIELKTVQILDGEDLPVSKPCIYAQDECYNVEWSTELTVPDAYDEYVKAWFLLHVLMKELDLSNNRDFMFNMSVGYDLEGIKSPKVNKFIDGMIDASSTSIWSECKKVITDNLDKLSKFNIDDLNNISNKICSSITLSTLHGCPPQEIERIANYLLNEKKLNTFIKMNPTLLGEDFVRSTFDSMGYKYITLNPHHFKNDLQFDDAVSMLHRLKSVAKGLDLEIGVKLTNTLPTKITNNELPGEEMYMSGRSLFPLSITLAYKLAKEFNGDLKISYSGGVDFFNIRDIYSTGISPITFATTLLKPGGYERIHQLAKKTEEINSKIKANINLELLEKLTTSVLNNKPYKKEWREINNRKLKSDLPLFDCATAPCNKGCPINQQIPQYVSLVGEKKFDEAFEVIVNDNVSPAITSTICNHNCQSKCTRLDYDKSVSIRNMKNIAVINAQDEYISKLEPSKIKTNKKVAIIGAGVAGLATAAYLRRNGVDVTVFEKRDKPYGVIQYVIPEFRIEQSIIEKDFDLIKNYGVNFNFGSKDDFIIDELKKEFDYIVLAIGAWKPLKIDIIDNDNKTINALEFLEDFKHNSEAINLGKNICIIGGGDVAMDAARAAKRLNGVENVTVIYRRTKDLMPASKEEIELLIKDGIIIKELLSPKEVKDGKLICTKMKLGDKDSSGRRKPIETTNNIEIYADTVIQAVGDTIDTSLLEKNNIAMNSKGYPIINEKSETSIKNVYVAGDMKSGPATIVQAMADGKLVAKDILKRESISNDFEEKVVQFNENELYSRKGIISSPKLNEDESSRCLSCNNICELCVDVCPNRANMLIKINSGNMNSHQVLHIDGMCNECGNCGIFCPHDGNPYKDKFTIFWSEVDFNNSENKGFLMLDKTTNTFEVRKEDGLVVTYKLGEKDKISEEYEEIIKSCIYNYNYII